MKTKTNYKITGVLAAVMMLAGAQLPSAAMAWGPQTRPTYTNATPADHAVFNSITDNAAVGNERDFVRVAEKKADAVFVNELEIEAGKDYEVYIYYHNDASDTYNYPDHDYVGTARNVRLASSFPTELAAGERGEIMGKITATNTDPLAVWDEAYVTAKEAMTLSYVTASAKIYNQGTVNESVLSTSLFTDTGTFLGYNALNGIIPGCDQYSGQVVYTIRTKAVVTDDPEPEQPEEPVDPTPEKPEPEPELPEELPQAGPVEMALAVALMTAMMAGIVYWFKTHQDVKRATRKAKGRK